MMHLIKETTHKPKILLNKELEETWEEGNLHEHESITETARDYDSLIILSCMHIYPRNLK
jgi:hypothetical protein